MASAPPPSPSADDPTPRRPKRGSRTSQGGFRSRTIEPTTAGRWPSLDREDIGGRVYVALLHMARPSRSLLLAQGFSEEEADEGIAALAPTGLLNANNSERIIVHDPDLAVPAYAAALEKQAGLSRAATPELSRIFQTARSAASRGDRGGMPGVLFLDGPEAIIAGYERALSSARTEVLMSFATGSVLTKAVLDPEFRERVHRGRRPNVPARAVFDRALLEVEGAHEQLLALADEGLEIRLAQRVAGTLVAADGRRAVVDLTHNSAAEATSIELVDLLQVRIVDVVLRAALAASAALPRIPELVAGLPFEDRDLRVLALMAAGVSDAAIARQLRISQRTVERRIAHVLEVLDAQSRFQAGVEAVRRGLI